MSKKKVILVALLVLIVAGVGAAIFVWNKPRRVVEDEKGMSVSAIKLFEEYNTNEKAANTKYLNKALQVDGEISSVETNQDGQKYLILQTGDIMAGVMCTMRDKTVTVKEGDKITVKGFCSGLVNDVKLTDCILVN